MASTANVHAVHAASTFREEEAVIRFQENLKKFKYSKYYEESRMDELLSDSEDLLKILERYWDMNEKQLRLEIKQDIADLLIQIEDYFDLSFLRNKSGFQGVKSFIEKYSDLSLQPTITVCFTPEEDVCLDKILHEINKASSEILVQAYTFNSKPVADALKAAHERGVEVRMLIDKKCSKTSLITELEKCGIKVQVDEQAGIAHNKVMIIDDECIITGSYNWTVAAEKENSENVVIIKNRCVTSMYKDNFWHLENELTRLSSEDRAPFPLLKSCDRCKFPIIDEPFVLNKNYTPSDYPGDENYAVVYACFTPRSRCSDLFVRALESAEKTILVQASCFTLQIIASTLINSKKKGVDVQLLVDKSAFNKKGQQIDNMGLEGIPIIIDNIGGTAHNKVIVIDDDSVLTGSYNLSNSAENRNSENVIFIKNFYVNQIFKQRWKSRAERGIKYQAFQDESTHHKDE